MLESYLKDFLAKIAPITKEILEKKSENTLESQVKELYSYDGRGIKTEGLQVFHNVIEDIWDTSVADTVTNQLKAHSCVNTADHFEISKASFFQGNVFSAYGAKLNNLEYSLILPCSNIAFSSATRPGKITWENKEYNLATSKQWHQVIYNSHAISKEKRDALPRHLQMIINDEILALKNMPLQICHINTILWNQAFGESSVFSKRLYVPLEKIIIGLLNKSFEIKDSIHSAFTDLSRFKDIIQNFAGKFYCWDETKGTHLFWHLSSSSKLKPLRFDGKKSLANSDYYVEIDPQAITEELSKGRIIPGLFLSYIILLEYNCKILGGIKQCSTMPRLWEKWRKLDQQEVDHVQTTIYDFCLYNVLFDRDLKCIEIDKLILSSQRERQNILNAFVGFMRTITLKEAFLIFKCAELNTQLGREKLNAIVPELCDFNLEAKHIARELGVLNKITEIFAVSD